MVLNDVHTGDDKRRDRVDNLHDLKRAPARYKWDDERKPVRQYPMCKFIERSVSDNAARSDQKTAYSE